MKQGRNPVEAVQHGLVVLASAWQGLWLLSSWLDPVSPFLLGLATLGWLAMVTTAWVSPWRVRRIAVWLNLTLLAVVAGALILGTPADAQRGITAITMLASLLGVLLPSRMALVLVLAVVAAELGTLIDADFTEGVLISASTLAVGLGALLARLALMRAAARAMAAQQATADQVIRTRATEEVAAELLSMERIVHATVLNTLTALGRGTTSDASTIRERALEGAAVLDQLLIGERLGEAQGSLAQDIDNHVRRLEASGIAVDRLPASRLPPVPGDVEAAIRGALDESVTNIIRHSGATRVRIDVKATAGALRIRIRDDGRGIAPGTPHRIGLGDIVVGSMQRVGGSVEIRSDERGTAIELSWRRGAQERDPESSVRRILARFTAPFLAVFWGYSALRVALTWDLAEYPGYNALAFALFTALVILLAARTRRYALDVPTITTVLIGSPLIYQLEQLSRSSGIEWSSEAIAALFIVVIGAGPAWAWPATIGVWLLIQGDLLAEIIAPGFAILVAIGIFAISYRRNAARFDQAREELVATQSQEAASEALVTTIRARGATLGQGEAAGLLRNIATGDLDPRQPAVRQQCVQEERLLRTVLRLNPVEYRLHQVACRLALEAYRRGIALDVDVAATDTFDDRIEEIEPVFVRVLHGAYVPGACRLMTQRMGTEWILTFTVMADDLDIDIPKGVTHAYISDDSTWLLEWRVSNETSDRR